jgi:hypothetical protein
MPADGIPRRRRTRGKVDAELGFSTNQLQNYTTYGFVSKDPTQYRGDM